MATLNCTDGTTIQISAETEAELKEAFRSKPPERTYKIGNIFWRDEQCDNGHFVRLVTLNGQVGLLNVLSESSIPTFSDTMNGFYIVQDTTAITMAEVRSMTAYPKGLRHVHANRLIITEK